ncbi:unnamed protein product [Lactuca virosa]|uniref:Sulfhydryl oxidase n=1 Tax=Lactuca virosa TaxID=75947 RepID=A0AAU9P4U9_9ASTR|nr:unnamed protein product [Lactuca virosa]
MKDFHGILLLSISQSKCPIILWRQSAAPLEEFHFSIRTTHSYSTDSSLCFFSSSTHEPTHKANLNWSSEQRRAWKGHLDFHSHSWCSVSRKNPNRQQKKDVKELMAIISRIYPCKECADHFKEVLRSNPVQAGSQGEFSQWLCRVHNVVNRSLGKPTFPCERVDARWGKLDCEHRVCDLQGSMTLFSTRTD